MSKITLNNVGSLADTTTAGNTINANNATIQNAFDNTLSRDGTSPNQMSNNLDMNGNQIINLSSPATAQSPLRLQDLVSFTGGGTIATVPAGGTTSQILQKTSNTDYAMAWQNLNIVAGTNITVTGSPSIIATVANPNFTSSVTTPTLNVGSGIINGVTGTGTTAVLSTSPVITSPVISTISNTGTLTLPTSTDTLVGRATTDTLTNKTLTSPVLVTPTLGAATATSLAFSPTTGGIIGTNTNDSANVGNVGEFVSSTVVQGSAISLTTAVQTNLTSISLTAGDWDVSCQMYFLPTSTTSISWGANSISLTSATMDFLAGNFGQSTYASAGTVTGATTFNVNAGPRRLSISGTTTVFAVAQANFTASTLSVWGILRARRIR